MALTRSEKITARDGERMETLLQTMLEGFPMFAGFGLLVYILNKQNEKQWTIIERVLSNCEKLEARLDDLAQSVKALSKS